MSKTRSFSPHCRGLSTSFSSSTPSARSTTARPCSRPCTDFAAVRRGLSWSITPIFGSRLIRLAEWIGWRAKQPEQNIFSPADIHALASLSDFEVIKAECRLLSPLRLLGIGSLINRFISILPLIRHLSLRHYSVCRSLRKTHDNIRSASVIIPARNERGNIEPAIKRMPRFCDDLEIIFVEGHSSDGTPMEIKRVAEAYSDWTSR